MSRRLDLPENTRRLVCVTDIPTPYRLHMFETLNEVLSDRGVDFEVLFLARTVSERFWDIDIEAATFQRRVARGIHPRYKGITFHLNPEVVSHVARNPPSWLLLGGAWNMPTIAALAVGMPYIWPRCRTILWAEANPYSQHFSSGIVAGLRRLVARNVDGFLVPGQIAEKEVAKLHLAERKPVLRLPNIVDERLFEVEIRRLRGSQSDLRRRWGINSDDRILLWPARLHEGQKGIINFLSSIARGWPDNLKILIAGEGPDRAHIEAWLRARSVVGVRLLGHVPGSAILELLAIADALLLPSPEDPNPLSIVEGLWAALPLLMSNRCGNWPEALDEGKNGWLVDPSEASTMRTAFDGLLTRSRDELQAMGRHSLGIARARFATVPSLSAFADGLDGLPSKACRVTSVTAVQ